MKTTFAIPEAIAGTIFLPEDRRRLEQSVEIIVPPAAGDFVWEEHLEALGSTQILVTGWRTPPLPTALLSQMPRLAFVANASGGVKGHLPQQLWEAGVRVVTASSALGWGVAEFTLALMLLGSKRALWLVQNTRRNQWQEEKHCFGGGFELFDCKVGLIGAGQSGRHLLRLLAPFQCQLFVYDPYVPAETLAAYGAKRVDHLEELFETCRIVSLHAALTPETCHLLRGDHFRRLAPGSLFVNTARAGLVHEGELIEALRGQNFVACIDVAMEEPPAPDHPYRHLPNVILTPHIAGAIAENRFRLGRLVTQEIEHFLAGRPLQHEVVLNQLHAIA